MNNAPFPKNTASLKKRLWRPTSFTTWGHLTFAWRAETKSASSDPFHLIKNIRSPDESVAPMIFSACKPRSKPRTLPSSWGCAFLGGGGVPASSESLLPFRFLESFLALSLSSKAWIFKSDDVIQFLTSRWQSFNFVKSIKLQRRETLHGIDLEQENEYKYDGFYLDEIGAVQVVLWFPGVFFGAVSFPGQKVFDFSVSDALVQDLLHNVLLLHDGSQWFWRRYLRFINV